MPATDQQRLDALRDTYLRIASADAAMMREGLKQLGFHSLKDLGDEIDRLETKVASAVGRRPFNPITRVDA